LVYLAHTLHLYVFINGWAVGSAAVFFTACFVTIFVVGVLTGVELPLLIGLGNELAPKGRATNRVLGFDYLGALVGGVLFPLLLVPYLELLTIGLLTANVNLFVAACVLYRASPSMPNLARRAGTCAVLTFVLVAGYANLGSLHHYFLKHYYYYFEKPDSLAYLFSPMSDMPEVFRTSSRHQKIDIVHDPRDEILIDAYFTKYVEDPSQPRDRFLFLNGDLQVASNYEKVYHEFFAHVPVLLHGELPERVLVMGAGTGCSSAICSSTRSWRRSTTSISTRC
jgi:spermidine synthase